jgi:hypothetical protein
MSSIELEDMYFMGRQFKSCKSISNPLFLTNDVDLDIGMKSADIYKSQVLREDKFKHFNPDAKYLKWRRVLVDWLLEVGTRAHTFEKESHLN